MTEVLNFDNFIKIFSLGSLGAIIGASITIFFNNRRERKRIYRENLGLLLEKFIYFENSMFLIFQYTF